MRGVNHSKGRKLFRSLVRLAHAVPVVVTALVGLVHFTPLIPWITRYVTVWDSEPRRGILIVLGAEQQADGTIGLMSYWRCVYAANLFKKGAFTAILVSGGASNYLERAAHPEQPPPPPLAQVMSEFLQAAGVPKQSIIVEAASSSTRRNALESAPILARLTGPFTLVTSDFHSFRALHCFRRAGVNVQSWPVPDVLKRFNTWGYRIQCGVMLAEEATKTAYYWWKGWI